MGFILAFKGLLDEIDLLQLQYTEENVWHADLITRQAIHSPSILHYTLAWAEMCHRKYNEKQ